MQWRLRQTAVWKAYRSYVQVLSLKSIQFTITDSDFAAIASLEELEEVVLDCDQPPEGQGQSEEAKWGLLHFPEAMKQLTNMTHLTLSCHYGITALPQGISRLNKLEVCVCLVDNPAAVSAWHICGHEAVTLRQAGLRDNDRPLPLAEVKRCIYIVLLKV